MLDNEAQDLDGNSFLCFAANEGYENVVELLLSCKVTNVNIKQ
jgi:ankyrin repeat protein